MSATRFRNTEDGVKTEEIGCTGDYLIERAGEWYYWLATTHPTDNHGPYPSREDALAAYSGL